MLSAVSYCQRTLLWTLQTADKVVRQAVSKSPLPVYNLTSTDRDNPIRVLHFLNSTLLCYTSAQLAAIRTSPATATIPNRAQPLESADGGSNSSGLSPGIVALIVIGALIKSQIPVHIAIGSMWLLFGRF